MPKYSPFPVQKRAHKAFLVDGYKRGLLYWSRRCFTGDALVMTATGVEVPIKDVRPGMWVVSHNGRDTQPKEVLELHRYGIDQDPKPMIQFTVNGKTITSTYDHEFYSDGYWVPLYQLAWGALGSSQRLQLKLLCQQYGKTLNNPASRWLQDGGGETSTRRFWVFKDGDRRQDNKDTPSSRPILDSEPPQQAANQSHRQQPNQQQDREHRVGDESRESSSHDDTGSSEPQRRGEVWNSHLEREGRSGDSGVSNDAPNDEQVSYEQRTSKEIPSLFGVNTPYFEGQDLEISETKVLPGTVTYDLTVADNHNYVVHGLSVHNTGKTLWSVEQLMWSCMLNQGPHHIVFKEYQQAETVAWNQYLHLIPKEIIKSTDKTLLTVTFRPFSGQLEMADGTIKEITHDPDKPPASIRLLGSDKADAHRGGESYGMIFDEYQDQDSYGWDFVYQPMLLTTDGWAAFMGTAKDRDEWNEMLDRAENNDDWYFSKATWRDNPNVKPATITRIRKEAEQEGKLGPFLQEHELIPFTQQGAVYPLFNRNIHVIKPDDVPEEGTEYIALDFGFTEGHPLAACFIRITRDDIWYQWDEIHGTQIQIDDAIAEMKVKLGDRKLTTIIADSARPDLIDYMASRGLPVVPSPKKQNSITSGIDLLRKRIKPKVQIMGDPKPNYYVASNCKKTIHDWTHYRYREIKENRPASELPEKKFDDSLDAIRYLELFFKFGHPKEEKIPKSSVLKEFGEFGV